jgi:imidazolonepropionase-like amidohydrolase
MSYKTSLLVLLLAVGGCDVTHAAPLVLRGATVIDGTGKPPLENATLVVDNGRVVSVASDPHIPRGARVIDVRGKFIIPGMMDANVHLDFGITPEYLFGFDRHYDELILEAAQVELKNGVTTVFDTWGPREPLVKVRDRINAGNVVGARMFIAGNIIGIGGPTSADFYPAIRAVISKVDADRIDAIWEQGVGADLLWQTPAEVRARVRAYVQDGKLDFVKYLSSGHVQMQMIAFSPDAQRAIVEEAHRAGLTVQAHSTSPESLKLEIEAGVDLLQHCDISGMEPIPDETIKLIVERHLPCAALLMTNRHLAWSDERGPLALRPMIRAKDASDRKLIDAGATLLLTTDGGLRGPNADSNPIFGASLSGQVDQPTALGAGNILWLEAAIERGMKPMEALLSATRNVAVAYKKGDLGSLEPGKYADFLVLGKDPLADPENYASIVDVYKEGVRVERSALPTARIMAKP